MGNLNPIFNPGTQSKQVEDRTSNRPSINQISRATRSDKKDDIKFPVTKEMLEALTRGYRDYKKKRRGQLFQTGYNTLLLENALNHKHESYFASVEYKDTKIYKHVKLTQYYSDKVFELMLLWNCSAREAVYRIFFTLVERNDTLV